MKTITISIEEEVNGKRLRSAKMISEIEFISSYKPTGQIFAEMYVTLCQEFNVLKNGKKEFKELDSKNK